jgi:plastocyanin
VLARALRHRLLPILVVVTGTALAAASFRAHADDTGAVAGHVWLTARIRGAALPSSAYPTRSVQRHDAAPIPEIRNVVVYLKNAPFAGALPPKNAEIRQEDEAFVPHVVAITRGSTVSFPNEDPYYHNVFSLSSAASFDLGRFPRGESRTRTFGKAGLVKVYCKIHSHMSATVVVFDHPYFVVPQDDGRYEIADVPAGDYTIVGWHERVGERTEHVRVFAGRTSAVDLTVPVEDVR